MIPSDLTFDDAGLIPAIVQDAVTGQVRMLGWMNAEALSATERTSQVHFWSRSRRQLWRKGETSGNTLVAVSIEADCDRDAVLVRAVPNGPTCHTGAETCFGDEHQQGFGWLEHLNQTVVSRIAEDVSDSYTAGLARRGVDGPARKVIEEAAELSFAAKDHARSETRANAVRVSEEAADLVYHVLVLLAERGIEAHEVIDSLRNRHE